MKHRALIYGQPLPQDFLDALQEYLATHHSNIRITSASGTAIQIVADATDGQASIGIDGLWRYNQATVTAAHPGGTAGQYDILVVASANSFTAGGGNETDNTDYTFGLQIVATGGSPVGTWNARTIVANRKIGEVTWSGSAITAITNMLGQPIVVPSNSAIAAAILLPGTLAARPAAAAANTGFYYYATDSNGGTLYQSTGAAWTTLAIPPAAASIDGTKLAPQAINAQAGSYGLVVGDRFKLIQVTAAGATTITVPTDASQAFSIGDSVDVIQWGVGQITFAPAGGVTLVGNPGLKTVGQYAMVTLIKMAANSWVAVGGLTP